MQRGMSPLQAIRAATVVGADLSDPLDDATMTRQVAFVMKDGTVHQGTARCRVRS